MTLNQLKYFQAVCNHGGVNRAAEILNISQPSVSNSIKELEKEFGLSLFIRENKRLNLTKEGEEFLRHASRILQNVEEAERAMKSLAEKTVLKLGIPPMLSSLLTPFIYDDCKKAILDLHIEIVEGDRQELMEKLEKNLIHIALLPYNRPSDSKYRFEHIVKLENVACVHRDHPLANRRSVAVRELVGEPLIMFKDSFFQTGRILERFACENLAPHILLNTVQLSTLKQMVHKGLGIGFVYEFVVKSEPAFREISLEPPLFTDIYLVWRNGGYAFSDIKKFLTFAKRLGNMF